MFECLFKKPTISIGPSLTDREIRIIFNGALLEKMHPRAIVILADSSYTTISEKDVRLLYKQSGIKDKVYRSEVFDCDDFAADFKAMMGEAARKNKAVKKPFASGIVYGELPTPHAINWFITPEKKLMFIEPQSGKIMAPWGENISFLYT